MIRYGLTIALLTTVSWADYLMAGYNFNASSAYFNADTRLVDTNTTNQYSHNHGVNLGVGISLNSTILGLTLVYANKDAVGELTKAVGKLIYQPYFFVALEGGYFTPVSEQVKVGLTTGLGFEARHDYATSEAMIKAIYKNTLLAEPLYPSVIQSNGYGVGLTIQPQIRVNFYDGMLVALGYRFSYLFLHGRSEDLNTLNRHDVNLSLGFEW